MHVSATFEGFELIRNSLKSKPGGALTCTYSLQVVVVPGLNWPG